MEQLRKDLEDSQSRLQKEQDRYTELLAIQKIRVKSFSVVLGVRRLNSLSRLF
jgi:hypothetical protein